MTTSHPSEGAAPPGGATLPAERVAYRWTCKVIASLGWGAAIIGGLILLGWIADLPLLKSWLPHQVEAKPNTAVGLIMAGVALVLKAGSSFERRGRIRAAGILAAIVALVGLGTVVEYAFSVDLGIDFLVFREAAGSAMTVNVGRMALPTAWNFLLIGWALLLLRPGHNSRAVSWLSAPVAALASFAFIGHLYNVPWLTALGPFTPIALPTGVAFLLLSAGTVLAGWSGIGAWLRKSGLVCALLLLLLLTGGVACNTAALIENTRYVAHTYQVLDRLTLALSAMQDIETAARGYLLIDDPAFLEPYDAALPAVARLQTELHDLISDNPGQLQRLYVLRAHVDRKLAATAEQIARRKSGDASGARDLVAEGRGRRAMDLVRQDIMGLRAEELRLLRRRNDLLEASTSRTLITLVLGLGASSLLLLTSFSLLRREIARRTQMAGELQRSEESLAITLNSIGDGVLATDTQGRVTRLNPIAEQLTGWTIAEARGRPVREIFNIIHEGSREPSPIPVDNVLATGETMALANHTALIARDGTERAIADSAAPIRDREGVILGVVLVFRDVSESRKAQAELDRFFTLSLDFLCISSADGYFKRVSPGVSDMLGWTPEEFMAQPYIDLVHPDDHATTIREVQGQLANGERVLSFENRYRHKDGSWRLLSWRSVPDPQSGLMYATARDVTEARRKEGEISRLNADLQRRSAALEVANKELESFSYSVSHDLRAPLRHIHGYVEMLAREMQDHLTDKGRRYLKVVGDAGKDMGALIDDLLAFSRMGRAEMSEREVNLVVLVDEVRRALEFSTKGREINWTIPPLPLVRGDESMLRIVLTNVLGNAVKYTRGRAPAEIELGYAATEEGTLMFFVRDNGAGFDMKYADKLFGVFQRLHHANEFEGTGIGLASVRRIIARHGGRTWAEGCLNAGATLYFTLKPASAQGSPPNPAPL